jgi:hypothetical protein
MAVPLIFSFRKRGRVIYLPRFMAKWFASRECNRLWEDLLVQDRSTEMWLRAPVPCCAMMIRIHKATLRSQIFKSIANGKRLGSLELIQCDFSLESLKHLAPMSSGLGMMLDVRGGQFEKSNPHDAVVEVVELLRLCHLAVVCDMGCFQYWKEVAMVGIQASRTGFSIREGNEHKYCSIFLGQSGIVLWDNLLNEPYLETA